LKIKLQIFLYSLVFFSIPSIGNSQITDYHLIRTVPIRNPVSVSLDRNHHIYISDLDGNINKFNSVGDLLLNYSPQKIGKISLLEGWFSVRVFAFYQDYQEFLYLDRFLTPTPVYTITQDLVGFARVATLGNDDNIWILDDSDISLKKLDKNVQFLILNVQLNTVLKDPDHDINFMREYQNQLFINNANEGIMVFDNLGNYKYLIHEPGLKYFNFLNDEIYYYLDSTVIFHHLYTQKKRSIEVHSSIPYLFALIVDEKLLFVGEQKLDIFQLN